MSTLQTCISAKRNSPAIIIPSPLTTLSHKQLLQSVSLFQTRLAAIGISPGDAVAIAFPNTIEFVIAFLSITFQRAICAPLNPAYKQDEFEFYLEDLKAAIVLVPRESTTKNLEVVRAANKCNTRIVEIYWNGSEVCLELYEDVKPNSRKDDVRIETPDEDDTALILHTSGTTGRPKAVPLTHKNLCRTMFNIESTYRLTSIDRTLLVMPLFHVHGLIAGFLSPLLSGGSVIVPPRFSASDFWSDFVTHGATWYTAVPTIHQILLRSWHPSPMPVIRFIRSCSSPLSPTVHHQLETTFGAPVLEAYAMTEAAHQMTSNPLPPAIRKPGSVGIPQGLDLQITDNHDGVLEHGQIGNVCVFGSNVTRGYLGQCIEPPFTGTGYLRTGDQGYLDQDGYLFLTGRVKELINKGGEKISPVEIDNLFTQHPKVAEAVTFAIEDDLYGQAVAVAVVIKTDAVSCVDELLLWLEPRIAKFKIPKKIFFTETMPKTVTGKVQRGLVAKTMLDNEKAMRDNWKVLLNSEQAFSGTEKSVQLSSSVPQSLEPSFDFRQEVAAT